MRKYKDEAAFSSHLCKVLTEQGCFVQRIESRETGCGIPDLYAGVPGFQYWIELKRIKTPKPETVKVPWRPGQQAWMYNHWKRTTVPCFTFIAFDDCIAVISHTKLYRDNIITNSDIVTTWRRTEDVALL